MSYWMTFHFVKVNNGPLSLIKNGHFATSPCNEILIVGDICN
jgi:hypothetical protein